MIELFFKYKAPFNKEAIGKEFYTIYDLEIAQILVNHGIPIPKDILGEVSEALFISPELVKFYVDKGARANVVKGDAPLWKLAHECQSYKGMEEDKLKAKIRYLLKSGDSITKRGSDGRTPLEVASKNSYFDGCKAFKAGVMEALALKSDKIERTERV